MNDELAELNSKIDDLSKTVAAVVEEQRDLVAEIKSLVNGDKQSDDVLGAIHSAADRIGAITETLSSLVPASSPSATQPEQPAG